MVKWEYYESLSFRSLTTCITPILYSFHWFLVRQRDTDRLKILAWKFVQCPQQWCYYIAAPSTGATVSLPSGRSPELSPIHGYMAIFCIHWVFQGAKYKNKLDIAFCESSLPIAYLSKLLQDKTLKKIFVYIFCGKQHSVRHNNVTDRYEHY